MLGTLAILAGIAGLAAGVALLAASLLVGTISSSLSVFLSAQGYPSLPAYVTTSTVAVVLATLGSLSLLVGLFWLAEGFGALRGKGWAWTVGLVIFVLSMINSIIQIALGNLLSIVSLLINIGIVAYLFKGDVRAYFGKTLEPTWRPQQGAR